MRLPARVRIVEMGPRDGLQNEPKSVPTAVKVELIERLADAGLPAVEATAFVSPKWVPQMADHAEVLRAIRRKPGVSYPVLVPNMQGFEAAAAAGARRDRGVRRGLRDLQPQEHQRLDRREHGTLRARRRGGTREGHQGARLRLLRRRLSRTKARSTPAAVAAVAKDLYAMGCYEISLGDTIGVGTPGKVKRMIEAVAREVPVPALAVHLHDTWGQALANLYAAMELGVATADSSVAGLGGCPYAKGASGNVATEDVIYMLDGLGIETGVDLGKVFEAGRFICDALGREPTSKVAKALAAKRAA